VLRQYIIYKLVSKEDIGTISFPLEVQLQVDVVIQFSKDNPIEIPRIRYELETYSNDLNPPLSTEMIRDFRGKVIKVIDVGA
jgi:hypothetical protein